MLEISHRPSTFDERVTVIALDGQIDHLSAQEFEDYVIPLLEPGRAYLLDMSEVNYVNSAGLGAVAFIAKRIEALDSSGLILVGVESRIRRTMEIVQLDQVLTFAESEDEGCAKLAHAAGSRPDGASGSSNC